MAEQKKQMKKNKKAKTKVEKNLSVEAYINAQTEPRLSEGVILKTLFEKITKEAAQMWGTSIVGCDSYHYRYESGREGDMCLIGFSLRKGALSIYIQEGFENHKTELELLGKHKIGKSCLTIKKLSDVDLDILEQIITNSVDFMRKKYPRE